MKSLRLRLPVVDLHEADALLEVVTAVDGVVAALLDSREATVEVAVASDASALLVREQLVAALAAVAVTA